MLKNPLGAMENNEGKTIQMTTNQRQRRESAYHVHHVNYGKKGEKMCSPIKASEAREMVQMVLKPFL